MQGYVDKLKTLTDRVAVVGNVCVEEIVNLVAYVDLTDAEVVVQVWLEKKYRCFIV